MLRFLALLLVLGCFPLGILSQTNLVSHDKAIIDAFYSDLEVKGSLPTSLPPNWCTLPDLITCASGKVTRILFRNSKIVGSIPTNLGQLTSMTQLFLDRNSFTGTIPTELGSISVLTQIGLHENSLSGTVPTQLASLSLTLLNINRNNLVGLFPTFITSITSLVDLRLDSNTFSGEIPTEIGNLTKLTQLRLDVSFISGTIPTQIGKLTNLLQLYLTDNGLNGGIPTEIGNLTKLTHLYLDKNPLGGTIPTQIGNLNKLRFIFLQANQLTGTIPTQMANFPSLLRLRLDANSLSGTIPVTLGSFADITDIYLNQNSLRGSIPSELGGLAKLARLRVDENQLTGSIPATLTRTIPNLYSQLYLLGGNNICPLVVYSSWVQGSSSHDSPVASSTCTPCQIPTCLNGGTCSGGLNQHFSCACTSGFGGDYCDEQDFCNPNPCQNGGSCSNGPSSFICDCTGTGYEGTTCQNQVVCSGTNDGGASWPTTDAGNTATGTCLPGYTGTSPTRQCGLDGVFGTITNPCVPDVTHCTADPDHGNAQWDSTPVGTYATGTCAFGYSGSPLRECRVGGVWASLIHYHCTRTPCPAESFDNADWPERIPSANVVGTCQAGFVGSPTRYCSFGGLWGPVQSPCIPTQDCPAEIWNRETSWPPTAAGQWATGTCGAGWTGSPLRYCRPDGTWRSLVHFHCERAD